ncbi:hypothetical protein [Solidesulfovibrio sp. C21]|uniref:hypothetical protein n=1 Tax=Solidesulfovibrio sp. C21 TaxID=3398613 RepID=UPI0039FBAB22
MKRCKKITAYQLMLPLDKKEEADAGNLKSSIEGAIVLGGVVVSSGVVCDMKKFVQIRNMALTENDNVQLLQGILERAEKAKW